MVYPFKWAPSRMEGGPASLVPGLALFLFLTLLATPGQGQDETTSPATDAGADLTGQEADPAQAPGVSADAAAEEAAEEAAVAAFEEHLGETVPADIVLRDEQGNAVVLGEFIDKPTILMFVYFECPGICTPLLNEVADILGKSGLHPDRTPFQILTVSFEPTDTPEMAAAKRQNYLKLVGRPLPPETWRFFTADPENIRRFTQATGFKYMRAGTEYTHPGGIMFLSPEGKIVRYFYGLQFLPFDFKMGVYEAQRGKVTPTTARLLQFCFSYDPAGRTYVFNLARVIGVVMITSILFFLVFLFFSTRRKRSQGGLSA